jgi:5'-deoxynucleotidase YfbR-like HD superfamily hydrolase
VVEAEAEMSDTISKLAELEAAEKPFKYGATYLKILAHRKSNNVLRFHTLPPVKPETVGHHSAGVAILCIVIAEHKPSVQLLMAALLHDMHEGMTGDIPAMSKWASPKLRAALDDLEEQFTHHYLPFPAILTDYERRVLKQADMLDLCFKAKEEVDIGNREYSVVLNRGVKYLRENDPLPVTQAFIQELCHGSE